MYEFLELMNRHTPAHFTRSDRTADGLRDQAPHTTSRADQQRLTAHTAAPTPFSRTRHTDGRYDEPWRFVAACVAW